MRSLDSAANEGGFAAKFQGNALESSQCFLTEFDSYVCRTGKGDHVDERMRGKGVA